MRKKEDPEKHDWDEARWVYIETNIRNRPAHIGFVDDHDDEDVYLICPMVRTGGGDWLDSWTWREEVGSLPHLKALGPGGYFGEVVIHKKSITRVEDVYDRIPPKVGRCWYCGKRCKGRFCGEEHLGVLLSLGLGQRMVGGARGPRIARGP